MTEQKTAEDFENEVMEQLVDFDGGAAVAGTIDTSNNNSNNNENKNAAESSKGESQLNNGSDVSKVEVKKDIETSVEKAAEEVEVNTETNGEGQAGEGQSGEGKSDEGKSGPVDGDYNTNSSPPPDGEFEVESITDHKKVKGKLRYLIKWKGYSDEEKTWEYADDLFCEDLVKEYWEKKKKEEEEQEVAKKAAKSGKGKKSTQAVKPDNKRRPKDKPEDNDRPRKRGKKKVDDDEEDWENQVVAVETVTRDDKTGELMVFLRWINGETSKHPSKEANVKCPQKMIKFYEQRLTFAPPSTSKT